MSVSSVSSGNLDSLVGQTFPVDSDYAGIVIDSGTTTGSLQSDNLAISSVTVHTVGIPGPGAGLGIGEALRVLGVDDSHNNMQVVSVVDGTPFGVTETFWVLAVSGNNLLISYQLGPSAVAIAIAGSSYFSVESELGILSISGVNQNSSFTFGSAALVQPITINGTVAEQAVRDTTTLPPFAHVSISDPNAVTDTLTVTLSDPASGTLTNLSGGSYSSASGVYTVTGTASAVTAALDGLVFQPARDQASAGQTVTTSFAINVNDTAGASASDSASSVVVTETSPTFGITQSAYEGVLRVTPGAAAISQPASQIDAGSLNLPQYEISLINGAQALYTTLPALVTIDAMYGATPSSTTLTAAATATSGVVYYTAAGLHNLGYSDPNVWTIMGSEWSADPNSSFYSTYGSYGSNYSSFISAVYQREFGYAPAAQNLQYLLGDVPGVQQLLAGGGHPASPIQVVGGIYGYLLYVGQTYAVGQYASSTKAFLQAAANGTVTYGPELTKEFPPTTITAASLSPGPASQVAGSPAAAGPAADAGIITVAGSGQLIDPGSGSFTIQFMAGASADTLVLHAGGADQVFGFAPSADALDFGSLLSGMNLDLRGNLALLANYVGVTDQGSDALVNFAPNGQGNGSTIAVLRGLGSTVTSLDSLIAAGAVKIA